MIERRLRRLLLDASPVELRGEGPSEIARLAREDPDVRAAATRILDELRAIDGGLAEMARPGARHIPLRDVARPGSPAARPAPRRHASAGWRLALGLAGGAAALVVALLLWRQALPLPAPVAAQSITATLDASSPLPFAVFATDNPDIAIVWLFDPEES
jgi:hypothetical protein